VIALLPPWACQARPTRRLKRSLKLRAERRAGELLEKMPKAKGAAAGGDRESLRGRIVRPRDDAPTYADLDIDKHDAAHWQQMAEVPLPGVAA